MADIELQLMETPPKPKRKSKLTLLLIALLVLMTAATAFLGWRYFSGSAAKAVSPAQATEGAAAVPTEPAGEGKTGEAAPGTESAILNFEPFLVNLADREAFRYLRVTIRLKIKNKAAAEGIAATEVFASQMRDAILGILATKVADQITTSEGKEELKIQIAEKLNTFLPGKPITAVFFTDFVVQL